MKLKTEVGQFLFARRANRALKSLQARARKTAISVAKSSDCETRSLAKKLTEQKQAGVSKPANRRRQYLTDNALSAEFSLCCLVSRGDRKTGNARNSWVVLLYIQRIDSIGGDGVSAQGVYAASSSLQLPKNPVAPTALVSTCTHTVESRRSTMLLEVMMKFKPQTPVADLLGFGGCG